MIQRHDGFITVKKSQKKSLAAMRWQGFLNVVVIGGFEPPTSAL
jgi:hypothetical protein